MNEPTSYFSADYFVARQRFRQMVDHAGGRREVLELDVAGPGGEKLSIDIGLFGAKDPRRILLHSSGLHGVEGFAGSAVQLHLLDNPLNIPEGVLLILVHALNPYGMAWLRRANENNVDLNRNFLEAAGYSGAPEIYAKVDPFLNPKSLPSADFYLVKAAALIARYGFNALKQAVAEGQYEYPRGLFYGGKRLEEGPERYEHFLLNHLAGSERVIAIDVHTGLGKFCGDTLLAEPENYENARQVFGSRIAPLDQRKNPAYQIRGGLSAAVVRLASRAQTVFVTQEFGTCGPIQILHTLREENRWHHYGGGALDHPTKQALSRAFYPKEAAWREFVVKRGREVVDRAMAALMKGDKP